MHEPMLEWSGNGKKIKSICKNRKWIEKEAAGEADLSAQKDQKCVLDLTKLSAFVFKTLTY